MKIFLNEDECRGAVGIVNFVSGGLECLWRKSEERKDARPDFTCARTRTRTHAHARARARMRTHARARRDARARTRTHAGTHAPTQVRAHAGYLISITLVPIYAIARDAHLDSTRAIIRASANCRSCRRRLRG